MFRRTSHGGLSLSRQQQSDQVRGLHFVGQRGTLAGVDVTEAEVTSIPGRNLRVPRVKFVAVWTVAERDASRDWYALGVAMTCRWLANAVVRPALGPAYVAHAPVTERTARAYEELIEVECLTAEKLEMRRPRPQWLLDEPGWIEGVCATFRWAWRRTGPPPIQLDDQLTG